MQKPLLLFYLDVSCVHLSTEFTPIKLSVEKVYAECQDQVTAD